MNALKRCEGWCVKGTRHQAAKTATASSTIDTLFRKTIQLQGKPMRKAMLVQRIRQPTSASVISNSFNGKLLCFEGLWFWETKLRKGLELPYSHICIYAHMQVLGMFLFAGPVFEKCPSKVSRSSQAQKWPVLSVIPHWEVFSLKCLWVLFCLQHVIHFGGNSEVLFVISEPEHA